MDRDDFNGKDGSSWISLPPIPTLFVALALLPFSDTSRRLQMGASFWLFVGMVYLSLSTAYVICLGKGAKKELGSLQILAQGVALLVLPLGLGAPHELSWIGLAMSFAGMVILINRVNKALENPHEVPTNHGNDGSLLDEVPIPTLNSGGDGLILKVNREMLNLLDVEESLILGQKTETLFPAGTDRIDIKGRGWHIMRNPGEAGSELICLLEEIPQPAPQGKEKEGDMIHEPTGLFSAPYAERMAPAELKRSIRYRRWLSFIMIRISVVSMDRDESKIAEIKKSLFNSYGAFIKKHTRECDLGFFLGDGLYLVLMPETPNAGAKTALEKLRKIPEDVRGVLEEGMSASVSASLYHCSGHEKIDYSNILSELKANLTEEDQFEPIAKKI